MNRVRILPLLAVSVAALSLAAPSALAVHALPDSSVPAPTAAAAPLQYIGALEGVESFDTPQDAAMHVQQALDTGLNTLRVRLVWNYSSGAPSSNLTAVCNVAHAAEQLGLKALVLGLEPAQTVWPVVGNPADRGWFEANLRDYDRKLFDPGSGCLARPSNLQIMWLIGNEPNVHTFCDGSDKGTGSPSGLLAQHQACADSLAPLMHESYATIQADEKQYNVDLKVIQAGLSSNDAPLDLLIKYFQERRTLKYVGCDADYIGFHPYPLHKNLLYGLGLVPKLVALLQANGCALPIFFTEGGFTTAPPADGSRPCPSSNASVTQSQYTTLLSDLLATGVRYGVVGYINMLIQDDPCGGWSSGWYYSDGTPKPFRDQVRQIFLSALNPQRRLASQPKPPGR